MTWQKIQIKQMNCTRLQPNHSFSWILTKVLEKVTIQWFPFILYDVHTIPCVSFRTSLESFICWSLDQSGLFHQSSFLQSFQIHFDQFRQNFVSFDIDIQMCPRSRNRISWDKCVEPKVCLVWRDNHHNICLDSMNSRGHHEAILAQSAASLFHHW